MKYVLQLFVFLSFCTFMASAAENVVAVGSGWGPPGSTNNIITISLKNTENVRGVQLQLADVPDYLHPDSVWTAPGIRNFSVSFNEDNGFLNIVMISFNSFIPPDSAQILKVSYSVSQQAPEGQNLDLLLFKTIVMNQQNEELESEARPGKFIVQSENTAVRSEGTTPLSFRLFQNFPNPFNPETTIAFTIPATEQVRLDVFNAIGQHIRTLVNRTIQAGTHQVTWDGRDDSGREVAGGLYLYRLRTERSVMTKQLLLLK